MKTVARNKKALHDYEILEKVEAGIELRGTEVKSLRAGRVNLMDSYATVSDGELFLHHMHVAPFEQASRLNNHDPYRKRRLLLHKKEIMRLRAAVEQKHLTVIPLTVYFDRQWVKLEMGLCKGRRKYDKRQKLAKDESKKRLAQLMKSVRR